VVAFDINWDQLRLQKSATMPLKNPGVAAVAIRQDSRVLATAGWDGKVRLFHYAKRRPLALLHYHRDGVLDVCFNARNKRLASASKDGTIAIWSIYADA
jgi:WD40 repeat protein